ncbi:methyltransferase domain-containing protein [Desulfoscipio sp. XC116]|uniref:class I SAM-dependent methyltransferase n=1 Tax=Desulfoscipio sp. XC116 TaxID=3144975 RepID=UPI00325BE9B9
MDISDILKGWDLKTKNKQAAIEWWNSMSEGFGERPIPSFTKDNFLQLLEIKQMLNENTEVLDVGCGTGGYAIAIASRAKNVTGLDLSPQMIEAANRRAADLHVGNVRFDIVDWHKFDIKKEAFKRKFDLVFAHMTPAIQSYETFRKFSDCSRGWCAIVKPVKRSDTVYDEILKITGISGKFQLGDSDILNAFALLFMEERYPMIEYNHKCFESKQPLEKGANIYINRIKSMHDLAPEQETKIRDYLHSIAQDGLINAVMDTKTATLYWHV